MAQGNPYSAYHVTNVQTADQRTLIIMLYDGLLRYLHKATAKIEAKDHEGAHNYLIRSREIIAELISTLKPEKGGEVGMNLKRLYAYCFERLVEANLLKDASKVQEVIKVMSTLREGWAQMKLQGQSNPETSPERKQINVTM